MPFGKVLALQFLLLFAQNTFGHIHGEQILIFLRSPLKFWNPTFVKGFQYLLDR